jgi:hypothetical protein
MQRIKLRKTQTNSEVSAEKDENFRLDKTVDPLAVIALVLALGSSAWQAVGYLQGAKVDFILPELVEIRASREGWMTVNAQMSYVNTGRAEYSAIVQQELVRVRVHGKGPAGQVPRRVELYWQSFITTDYAGKNELRTDEDAHPFVVPGASAVSHQTSFFPRSIYCQGCNQYANYIKWDDVVQETWHGDSLEFEFLARIFDGTIKKKKCVVPLDDRMRAFMKKNRWYSRVCQERS